MQIVIDIPEKTINEIKDNAMFADTIPSEILWDVTSAIVNSTPLPKGHGRLKDVDGFLEKVKKDREHEIYLHSWTADMVLERLDSWYSPTIIESDNESE